MCWSWSWCNATVQFNGIVNLKLTASITIVHTKRNLAWQTSYCPQAFRQYVTVSLELVVSACDRVSPKLSASSQSGVVMCMPAMQNLIPRMLDFYINREHKQFNFRGKTCLPGHGRYCMHCGWLLIVTSSLHATEGMLQSVYCRLLPAGAARLMWSGRV